MSDTILLSELETAKEKKIEFIGDAGRIEAIFNGAQLTLSPRPLIAVLGHPHSLHGGTMNNKVVTTLAKTFRELGIPTLRFNFRGVGGSEGEFDKGVGESADLLMIMTDLKHTFPDYEFLLAGFSFGAYVTYRAACHFETALLISVAPAVDHGDFSEFDKVPNKWHVLIADADEVVDPNATLTWHKTVSPKPILHMFEGASHFFHGRLLELKEAIKKIMHA